jgi:hypothetical protein
MTVYGFGEWRRCASARVLPRSELWLGVRTPRGAVGKIPSRYPSRAAPRPPRPLSAPKIAPKAKRADGASTGACSSTASPSRIGAASRACDCVCSSSYRKFNVILIDVIDAHLSSLRYSRKPATLFASRARANTRLRAKRRPNRRSTLSISPKRLAIEIPDLDSPHTPESQPLPAHFKPTCTPASLHQRQIDDRAATSLSDTHT